MVLHDDYVARVGGFVMFSHSYSVAATSLQVGKVLEILADAHAGKILGVAIQEYTVGAANNPYHLPSISPADTGPVFCQPKVLLFTFLSFTSVITGHGNSNLYPQSVQFTTVQLTDVKSLVLGR